MKRFNAYLLFVLALFACTRLNAQTLQTDVLIFGNNNSAVAAAIQAAQSNAKTILVLQADGFDLSEPKNQNLSGIEAIFKQKMGSEALFNKLKANQVVAQWTDSLKNKLTVIHQATWLKAGRSGKNWIFKLSDKKTIRAEIFININDVKLNQALKLNTVNYGSWTTNDRHHKHYKTALATRFLPQQTTFCSLYDLIDSIQENLIYVKDDSSMAMGQAAGAVAAFCGFFKLNTSELNLRKIQAELLNFKASLIPIADVKSADKNWKAIQMLALSGFFTNNQQEGQFNFLPDSIVQVAEVQQELKNHFYKAQIWVDDNKNERFTLERLINLVCYVGNKAEESTKNEIIKKWHAVYGFEGEAKADKLVTRREFAAILNDYCSPFIVSINKEGKIQR